MGDRWKFVTRGWQDHDGHPCPMREMWPLINAVGTWHADPSPANTERLAAVVGAMITLGIMVPAGEVVTVG